MTESPYLVHTARILSVRDEAEGIRTYTLGDSEWLAQALYNFRPGQFVDLTVFGVGEAPFSVSHYDRDAGVIELTVARVGEVTEALHSLEPGAHVGLRGPYGNGFPLDSLRGKDLVLVAGGIGLAPMKPLVTTFVAGELAAKSLALLYGARTPELLCFTRELGEWAASERVTVCLTVDNPNQSWNGAQGPVTNLIGTVQIDSKGGKAVVCGPEVMMHAALAAFRDRGWDDEDIIFTLERRMECGIGKCGHCGIGGLLVCQDGPVFTAAQLMSVKEYMDHREPARGSTS